MNYACGGLKIPHSKLGPALRSQQDKEKLALLTEIMEPLGPVCFSLSTVCIKLPIRHHSSCVFYLKNPRNPSHGDSRFNSDPHPPFQTSETLLKPLTTFYQSVGSISFIIQFRRKLYLNKKKKWDDCSFLKLQTTNLNRPLFTYYARCACFMDNEKLDFRKPLIQSLLFKKL